MSKNLCNIEDNKKKAMIILNQIQEFQDTVLALHVPVSIHSICSNFNNVLAMAREVFSCDAVFAGAIKQIKKINLKELEGDKRIVPSKEVKGKNVAKAPDAAAQETLGAGYSSGLVGEIMTDLALIRGTMEAFVSIYMSETEKQQIGFFNYRTRKAGEESSDQSEAATA